LQNTCIVCLSSQHNGCNNDDLDSFIAMCGEKSIGSMLVHHEMSTFLHLQRVTRLESCEALLTGKLHH